MGTIVNPAGGKEDCGMNGNATGVEYGMTQFTKQLERINLW
jgi:hypothetical protein